MKKTYLALFLSLVFSVTAMADAKKVAYVTWDKTMATDATTSANDPIIQMLSADPNLQVTVKVVDAAAAIDDLATYDVIVVQEAFSSSAAILQTTGSLALKSIPKPFIYNKSYALKSGRALGTSSATGGKEAGSTLSITVEASALTNDLFKACTFGSNNDISIFNALTKDDGLLGDALSIKAINYSTGNVISGSSTILAQPSVLNADGSAVAVCINDIPAGSTIDSETTLSRMIAISMNFGAICANGGTNITDDGLTVWRNAVYILAGLTVPSTKATLPNASAVNAPNDFSALSFDGKSVYNTNSSVVNIFNVAGKLISTSSDKEINMSNFTKGIYIVKTNSNTLKVSILR